MARKLRAEGLSVRDIEERLGVARSSVSVWVRDITLTPEQHAALLARNPAYNGQRAGQAKWAAICRSRRAEWQEEGRAAARRGDPEHVAGCMLFWAEGSRHRNVANFTNSDPAMVATYATFLRRQFGLADSSFRVWCNLFADHLDRQADIEDFWLAVVGVPRTQLTRSTVNRYSPYTKKKRTNKLPYGTCRVTVHSTRVVQHLYGAIQEYAGFDRPEWLD